MNTYLANINGCLAKGDPVDKHMYIYSFDFKVSPKMLNSSVLGALAELIRALTPFFFVRDGFEQITVDLHFINVNYPGLPMIEECSFRANLQRFINDFYWNARNLLCSLEKLDASSYNSILIKGE